MRVVNPREIRRFRDEFEKEQVKLEGAEKDLQRLRMELHQTEMDFNAAREKKIRL